MSRSGRTAQPSPSLPPRRGRALFIRPQGGLRTGWLLAISLFCYVLLNLGGRMGLTALFNTLLNAWNINAQNAWRAPGWARWIYAWHASLSTLALSIALIAAAWPLRRLWGLPGAPRSPWKRAIWGLAGGMGCALLIAVLSLLPDSSRLEWPLSAPRLSMSLAALGLVSLVEVAAGEVFGKRVIFDGLAARLGRIWAAAAVVVGFFLFNGGLSGNVLSGVNVLLLGVVGCVFYARWGLWTSALFRWGWGTANALLLGFGGGDAAVYRMFGVSERLLTGGDGGPMYGLWATLLLAAAMALPIVMSRRERRGKRD